MPVRGPGAWREENSLGLVTTGRGEKKRRVRTSLGLVMPG